MSNNFEVDTDGFVKVYTDGACPGNGRHNAASGIGVFFGNGNYLNVSEPVPHRYRATNQVAEILAVKRSAEQALGAGIRKLRINTDSKFVIDCMKKWIPNWQKYGWRTSDGRDVINKTELEEMLHALRGLDSYDFVYVPAHNAYHGNEQADRLAKQGAAQY